ncbi:MAG: M10 family metallopeptidase [Thermodesulfobacteriota bacterium]
MSSAASPYVGEQSSLIALTGNALVDTFLGGSKWGSGGAGTAAAVSFGFPSSTTLYDAATAFGFYGDTNFSGYVASTAFAVFGATEQAAVRGVLQTWANVANITFSEVAADSTSAAALRFNYTGAPGLAAGTFAVSWFPMDIPAAGDTWVNAAYVYPDGWAAGSQNFLTLLHEIGHALGLKHPHDTGLAGVVEGWPATTNTLPFTGTDTLTSYSTENAVMAYNDVPGAGSPLQADFAPTTPMALDIAAFQYLYGANTAFNSGDTTYTFRADSRYNETIWDGGGADTIVASGDSAAVINLTPGAWSQLGLPITYSERNSTDLTVASARPDLTNANTVCIYDTVTIENAQGGGGNDRITGNTVANRLQGNGGDDSIDGGAGIDTALYSGNRSGYTLTPQSGGFAVQDNSGRDGLDSVSNVERLQFADTRLALDLDGNAGMTAKLLGAVFGAAAVANQTYAGLGLGLLDGGMGYATLAGLAVNVAGGTTAEQVVNLLWSNVVGSAPSAEQAQPFVDMLNSGAITSGALATMAADTSLNQANINLTGLAQTGLAYV